MKVKATIAVKYLEGVSYFEDAKEDTTEVVRIADAIRATQLAELEILQWIYGNYCKNETIVNRIKTLQAKLN